MFWLASFLILGASIGLVFGVLMSIWIWRTRPSRQVPAYRRAAADHLGRYPSSEVMPYLVARRPETVTARVSVDGRRRDLRAVSL